MSNFERAFVLFHGEIEQKHTGSFCFVPSLSENVIALTLNVVALGK